jgi:hypothetical protein
VFAALGINENYDAQVKPFLRHLDEVRHYIGGTDRTAIVVTHHMGGDMTKPRGSSTLDSHPDHLWRLTPGKSSGRKVLTGDTARYLSVGGRSQVKFNEGRLVFDPATLLLTLAGNDGAPAAERDAERLEAVEAAVLEYLGNTPGLSENALVKALTSAHGRNAARDALRSLVAAGKVHTAPGPRNATQHGVGDGCGSPQRCPGLLRAAS